MYCCKDTVRTKKGYEIVSPKTPGRPKRTKHVSDPKSSCRLLTSNYPNNPTRRDKKKATTSPPETHPAVPYPRAPQENIFATPASAPHPPPPLPTRSLSTR